MKSRFLVTSLIATALSVFTLGFSAEVLADPPSRVARISYLGGEVSFAPAGEDSWHSARVNRPLVTNDRLWTGQRGRVELELGTAFVRLDQGTSFEFLNLDDQLAQIQLTEGTINLRVDHLYEGQVYEIDTPTLAFVATQPGEYRLDIAAGGESTQVTVFDGYAEVYGEADRNVQVQAGTSYRFFDSALSDYERLGIPRADDFDQWAFSRNDRYQNSPTRQYVSEEMIGYADLDDYGSWRPVDDYGHVWFPRRVAAGWAPYRHGHWSWVDPWGWSWIDDEPWGFAPSHYGRWVYVANGWGWVPGPRHVRPVYAPALVAFVGGANWSVSISSGGPPIGWFPLGPRDVYVPWYQVSRGYFGRVNVHNTVVVNNVYVTNIYNDYYVQNRPVRRDYTFRNAANAVTVVPRDTFVSARNAAQSMTRLRPGALAQGELMSRAPAAPTRASLADPGSRLAAPPSRALGRDVIARTQPAARTASFDVRQRAIARNGGEPLAADQSRRLDPGARAAGGSRGNVRVLGRESNTAGRIAGPGRADPGTRGSSSREAVTRGVGAQPAPVTGSARTPGRAAASTRTDPSTAPNARDGASRAREARTPASTPSRSTRSDAPAAPRDRTGNTPAPRGELPSARYSRQRGGDTGRAAPARSEGIPLPTRRTNTAAPRATQPDRAPPARAATPPRSEVSRGREPTPAMNRGGNDVPAQRRQSSPPRSEVGRQSAPIRESAPQRQVIQREAAPQPRVIERNAPRPSEPPPVREAPTAREAPARREESPARRSAPEREERQSRSSARER
jgi:hypothetical protein